MQICELLDYLPLIYKLRNSTLKFIVSMSEFDKLIVSIEHIQYNPIIFNDNGQF